MEKKYYELVLEGHYNAIYGLLKGFLLGKNQDWTFYFSKKAGIKIETLGEIIVDWISLKNKVHHIILEENFYEELKKAVEKFNTTRKEESKFVNLKYLKSAQLVKSAQFGFETKTYGRPYAAEIKNLIKKLPEGVELHNYNPIEKENKDAKGVELYAPEHEYTFEASGTLSGNIGELIELRKTLDEHPLVEVEKIQLKF
ncbi:MAG TPA: hypothetical protein PK926_10250 [Spirochaetota bacterium]|nr:hypothetical protein [Spirochaetota bacterium]HPI88729.1 hypothetical protein [Spirochaetota bacterium]HPR48749.1 hypothetical protein [Spirochaetota bacterium]